MKMFLFSDFDEIFYRGMAIYISLIEQLYIWGTYESHLKAIVNYNKLFTYKQLYYSNYAILL